MDDPLVLAFRRICDAEGGYKALADRISANDQSLYQVYSGVKLPSGRPKGVGPQLRAKLDTHFPGWRSATDAPLVAHGLSYQPDKVPYLTREELMTGKDLPNAFKIDLPDDAMGAKAPKGTRATFERRAPGWGDAVLLIDAKGHPHVRVYRQSLEHDWEGVAPNPAFATFTGSMSGVRVVAVLESLGGGWAQLSR
jgi:hypothetical protein